MASRGIPGRVGRALGLLGPFLGLALITLLFHSLEPEIFLTTYNLKTMATQTVIVALAALGMTFVIISGGIDLSVGSVIALSSVITAVMLRDGWPAWAALLGGILTGGACGLVNGVLITGLRMVPFIVTLGMLGMARGFAKYLASDAKVDPAEAGVTPPDWFAGLMWKTPAPPWLLVAPGVWLTGILAVVMIIVLKYTVLGTATFAVGSSEPTARLCGLPVARTKVAIYTLCGLLAGLAGVMQLCRLTVGDPTTAMGKELDVIAAVVIGGGSLSGGEGSIPGTLCGALIMSFLSTGCNQAGVPNHVQEIIIGAIIIVAVALDRARHWR